MPSILYTVRITCPSVQIRGRCLAWLSPNHILEVMEGGATGARIVLPLADDLRRDAGRATDPGLIAANNRVSGQTPAGTVPALVEVQYVFPSRKAFDAYVRDHAPALRAEGLKHFPPAGGVTFERQVAEIAAEL